MWVWNSFGPRLWTNNAPFVYLVVFVVDDIYEFVMCIEWRLYCTHPLIWRRCTLWKSALKSELTPLITFQGRPTEDDQLTGYWNDEPPRVSQSVCLSEFWKEEGRKRRGPHLRPNAFAGLWGSLTGRRILIYKYPQFLPTTSYFFTNA